MLDLLHRQQATRPMSRASRRLAIVLWRVSQEFSEGLQFHGRSFVDSGQFSRRTDLSGFHHSA
jgi:hypothetical protein